MRILLTSDLHYKLRQYDWLIGAAPSTADISPMNAPGSRIDTMRTPLRMTSNAPF